MAADTTSIPGGTRLRIDVWGDVVCPWCYVGDARLEKAIEQSGHAEDIDVVFHTFELDPSAPPALVDAPDYVAGKYGFDRARAVEMETRLGDTAVQEGLRFEVDHLVSNTRDIMRAVQYANTEGRGWAFMKAVQGAIFAGDRDAFSNDAVVAAAARVGLDGGEVRAVLQDGGRFAHEVDEDRSAALELGAQGVPFTVLDDRIGLPGAASQHGYAEAIASAWQGLEERR